MLDDIAADELAADAADPIPAARPIPKLKFIRAACLECVDGQAEVRACAFFSCPLWPFRMSANPFPPSEARQEASRKAVRAARAARGLSEAAPRADANAVANPRCETDLGGPSERPTLDQLRAWAGRNLPMESVASPDPRDMTGEELAALGCTNRSPAKAIRRYEQEIDRKISWRRAM